jgi:hypothetical protein
MIDRNIPYFWPFFLLPLGLPLDRKEEKIRRVVIKKEKKRNLRLDDSSYRHIQSENSLSTERSVAATTLIATGDDVCIAWRRFWRELKRN